MVIILHLNEMKYVVITRFSRSLLWVKTIVDHRTCILGKPLKNHQCQWSIWEKNIQWWWSGCSKTIEKPSKAMVLRKKNITIPSFEKNDHRWSLAGGDWEVQVRPAGREASCSGGRSSAAWSFATSTSNHRRHWGRRGKNSQGRRVGKFLLVYVGCRGYQWLQKGRLRQPEALVCSLPIY